MLAESFTNMRFLLSWVSYDRNIIYKLIYKQPLQLTNFTKFYMLWDFYGLLAQIYVQIKPKLKKKNLIPNEFPTVFFGLYNLVCISSIATLCIDKR